MTMKKVLGKTGIEISAMGMGCWAIGGQAWENGVPIGWGEVNDEDSIRGLECGLEMGVNFLDTSNMYGAGHSERIIGKVLKGKRDKAVIATKFGWIFDEVKKEKLGYDASPAFIRKSLEDSMRRLQTDYIDLYLFHYGVYEVDKAVEVRDTLEELVAEGKIRSYGWSTDLLDRAEVFAQGEHCAAIEHNENIFNDNPPMLSLCESYGLSSVNRAPLAMGILSGKYTSQSMLKKDDIRGKDSPAWMEYFKNGKPSEEFLKKLENVREILTSEGRTLTQGALAWIWAKSPATVPIPGFRTEKQIRENAGAMEHGPLRGEQMEEIARILA